MDYVAIIGAGVSGLTCGVVFAERGYRTAIFAKETGQQTTSGAAGALWFPYDGEPAGSGARELVQDLDLEPHRGQVAVVPSIEDFSCAIVCDDVPLMYAIPRRNDCVFGGTNDISSDLAVDPATTDRIVAECSRVLNIEKPNVLTERVGLRPFRKSGVRLERDQLVDSRTVIHNYGHGGSGFTLSCGCAREVLKLATL